MCANMDRFGGDAAWDAYCDTQDNAYRHCKAKSTCDNCAKVVIKGSDAPDALCVPHDVGVCIIDGYYYFTNLDEPITECDEFEPLEWF